MKKIGIFIEEQHGSVATVGLELISETRRIVGDSATICAVYLTGKHEAKNVEKIKKVGPNEIIVCKDDRFVDYDTTYFTKALADINKSEGFDVLLLGSTLLGRDLAPRLSARLETGLTADATILEYDVTDTKVNLLATRPALGGNLFATILCTTRVPQMATIRPGVFSVEPYAVDDIKVSFVTIEFNEQTKVRIVARKKLVREGVDLSKANLIISGGRGVAANLSDVKKIAALVGGEAAASRAIVDAGLDARERLVGQTGTNVKPSIYVALGISGAIQHVSGMDKSDLIIAVNTDKDALIFNVADVSLVCDANAMMPLLIEKLETLHKTIN